jgi:uncharacterized protein YdcH (DUF465 family)
MNQQYAWEISQMFQSQSHFEIWFDHYNNLHQYVINVNKYEKISRQQ